MRNQLQLEEAMGSLEAQRAILGDAATDAAQAALQQELAGLARLSRERPRERGEVRGAELKIITVMFADISGFTALSEKLDPEAVRDLMNGCFQRLVPIVDKYEGTVDKFIGDEIMALFGAPVTHENDSERAVAAALDMMDELADFNAEHGLDLGIHFGINTGPVVAGAVGSDRRHDYSVMGDAVNLASRLEDLSERGQILVGPDTFRQTGNAFEFEALPPIRVKGKAEPVQVYQVKSFKKPAEGLHRAAARSLSSVLVGRGEELGSLYEAVKQLTRSRGRLVSILGEAGLGKSRLMAEVHHHVRTHYPAGLILWLEGRTLSFGQSISYRPFQEILWQLAGITEECDPAEAWLRLERRVRAAMGDQTDEVLPYVGQLVSLDVPERYVDRVKYLDGEAMRRQVFLASRRLFVACAETGPLVLVFEDLHWADEASVLLIEHLIPLIPQLPLLIVCVGRLEPEGSWARVRDIAGKLYASSYTEMRLTPLTVRDSHQLVRNLLDFDSLPSGFSETIIRNADGNPFFIEEIIRSLIDAGKVTRDPDTGAWTSSELDSVTIPDRIHGVIMARIDRLDEELRRVVRTAAVIGRSFLYPVLQAVQDADRQLDQSLADLEALELIREKIRDVSREYMFKHAITQQATYESILVSTRRQLHAKVAQVMEALFADRLEEISALLASHYAGAELWEKAQHYLRMAGDHAGRLAADTEALANYRQALHAYQKAFGETWDPFERASLHRKIGEALYRRGEHSGALEYLGKALRFLGRPLPATHRRTFLATVGELARQFRHRLLPWLLCAPLKTETSPAVEEEIRLYEVIGWVDAFGNYEQLFLVSLRALNVSERHGYAVGVTKGLVGLGVMADLLCRFRIARWYHRKAATVAEGTGNPAGKALAHIGWTIHHICTGQWDPASEHAQHARASYEKTGDLRGAGYSLYMTAVAAAYKGNLEEALSLSEKIISLGENGADYQTKCWGLGTGGFVLRLMGRYDEAITMLKKAGELAEEIQDHVVQMWSTSELGRCHLAQGNLKEALSQLEASETLFRRRSQIRLIWVPLVNSVAAGYVAAYNQAEEAERARWLKPAKKAIRRALRNGKQFKGLLPEALRLAGLLELAKGNRRSAKRWWTRSGKLAEASGQSRDLALTMAEMGNLEKR